MHGDQENDKNDEKILDQSFSENERKINYQMSMEKNIESNTN